jgi:nucleoside-diphosphate-sugar epimerase
MVTPRALVLGDAGFVGRHLAARLDRRGWHVAGLDRARSPTDDLRRRLPGMRGPWDLVAHCAAVIGGRAGIDGCPLCLAENFELDAVVVRWCAERRPGRLLYFSSAAVYPTHLQLPPMPPHDPKRLTYVPGVGHVAPPGGVFQLREDMADPTRRLAFGEPDRIYGWAKVAGEALCRELAAGGVPVTVVRPFSGYGSDQDPGYPFGAFCDRALALADPFPVWGSGRQVRDFVHVEDVVGAALHACEHGLPGPFNLCTGRPTSVDELARLFAKAAGYAPALEHELGRPAGVDWRVGDPTNMRALWPAPIELEDGISRALAERAH